MRKIYTSVAINKNIAEWPSRSIGTIVEAYEKPPGYLIEMNFPYDVIDVTEDDIDDPTIEESEENDLRMQDWFDSVLDFEPDE